MGRRITISPYVYLLLPIAFLLLPLRWVLAWGLAVAVHETGHYLALRLCRIPIWTTEITPFGVRMHTGELQGVEALVCSLAGPFAGLLLIILSRYLPYTALCAFLQAAFNLLPIYPLDGGRALRALLAIFISRESTVSAIENLIHFLVAGVMAYIMWHLDWGIVPIFLFLGIFTQKFLANRRNNGYNRGKNDF